MSKNNFFSKLRITYNAPATLTFALIAALILFLNPFLHNNLIPAFFTCPGASSNPAFNTGNFLDYLRLVFHVFGHSDWNHFLGNMAFILLLGPVVEERYGSPILVLMMTITSLVTGVLNACFSPTNMLGSSDIAFMMILLTSFTTISRNRIPLSFILILILYIGRELLGSGENQNIATFAHIAGGLCGSLFAFLATPRPKANSTERKPADNRKSSEEKTESSYGFANLNKRNTSTGSKTNTKSRYTATRQPKKTADEEETLVGSIEL